MWPFILLILLFFVFLLCFLLFLDSTMISNLLTVHSGQAHIAYRYESFRDFLFKKCHLWCVNFCNLNSLSQVHPCDKSSLLSVSMLHLAKLCLCKWKRYKVLSEVGDKGMPSGNWCDAFQSLVRKKETMQRNLEGLKLGKVCCCSAELIYLLSGRFLDSSGKLQ